MDIFTPEELVKHRENVSMTQEEVALKLGVQLSYIQKIENGEVPVFEVMKEPLLKLYGLKEEFPAFS